MLNGTRYEGGIAHLAHFSTRSIVVSAGQAFVAFGRNRRQFTAVFADSTPTSHEVAISHGIAFHCNYDFESVDVLGIVFTNQRSLEPILFENY